jgi:hypothetical protein
MSKIPSNSHFGFFFSKSTYETNIKRILLPQLKSNYVLIDVEKWNGSISLSIDLNDMSQYYILKKLFITTQWWVWHFYFFYSLKVTLSIDFTISI